MELPKGLYLPQLIIGGMFIVIFAGTLGFILLSESMDSWSENRWNVLIYLLGVLSAQLVTVMAFFYASSAGSKDKDIV